MPKSDVSKVNIVPYVSLADASVQDHSTMDKQVLEVIKVRATPRE